ncbi:MAG TPA: iron-containing alcohol dehydrogenase [Terriglobia bacterium]|nr:iron-containing alcohol dehydrogenase [Terriglobia bacterium]
MISTWSFPNRVIFGCGSIGQLPSVTSGLGVRRPLVVTDPGVVRCGLLTRITDLLEKGSIEYAVFDRVEGNPTEASVYPGLEAYRSEHCDGVIALGGGSALDAAKAIRLTATHALPLEEYDDLKNGSNSITSDIPPMIAMPTTAGTGSEVGRSTVITLKATGRKTVIFSPHLIPSVAIADPELTFELPPHLTAATGMDAMTHNLEAYLALGFHPLCDAIAIKGVEIVHRNLAIAVRDGRNAQARRNMMAAAIMGAVAFQKGLGTVHSLAHPLSTVAGVHHGLTNAILLPHVMRFNLPVSRARLADLAVALGVDTHGMSTDEAALAAIGAIEAVNEEIGIVPRLRDAGVCEEMIPQMVPLAMADGCRLCNPRPTTAQDMETLYRAAF